MFFVEVVEFLDRGAQVELFGGGEGADQEDAEVAEAVVVYVLFVYLAEGGVAGFDFDEIVQGLLQQEGEEVDEGHDADSASDEQVVP